MSLAHYFDNDAEAGFSRPDMTRFARRQLHMSLALVAVLALGAVLVASLGARAPLAKLVPAPGSSIAAISQARV